jgi:hypothetical protein
MLEIHLGDQKLYLHTHIKEERANLDTESRTTVLLDMNMSSKFTHFEIGHFLDCIRDGSRPMTDGPASLQGLRVVWRLYEAELNSTFADLRGLGLDEDWESVTT